ncbi:MAG: DUF1697 domain-containing protein [Candidatus Saccharimonadales bacterium]
MMIKYLALLRGINVGGNNKIKMTDLKACFEKLGFANVTTYIQSGNVVFEAPKTDTPILAKKIEQALTAAFSYKAKVVVVAEDTLRRVVAKAPKGFGSSPADYRYNVIFLKEPLTAHKALQAIPLKEEVDEAWAGQDVVFHQRMEARATQSYLNRLVTMPIYQDMTIRNWNTTTKLLALMEKTNA